MSKALTQKAAPAFSVRRSKAIVRKELKANMTRIHKLGMNRRRLLQILAALPFARGLLRESVAATPAAPFSRARPGDPQWPAGEDWEELGRRLEGRLIKVASPLSACVDAPSSDACAHVAKELKNPYYLGDEVGLTQILGWVGAWTSRASVYAVTAKSTSDVVAAVNFAQTHNLRLVVKGGGHSFQGTSNAADSLLIWTRPMRTVVLHDTFVGSGCEGKAAPQPAVSVEAGAIWEQVYGEVMVKAGRYVQGGSALTVGVAGLVMGGGFSSLSKGFGLAAASLLEAEVVTANGDVKLANACANPDLFWALKGGGSGFGVVTRLTLRTHDLPGFVGGVFVTIDAASEDAYHRLVAKMVDFYREALFNPQWGGRIALQRGNRLWIEMIFQGLDREETEAVWRPFFDWVASSPQDFNVVSPPRVLAAPGRRFWDPAALRRIPGIVIADDRPGAPESNIFWPGDLNDAGWVVHAFQSVWLPASLLEPDQRSRLVDALIAAATYWEVELQFDKGLAGGRPEAIDAAKDTAINPAVGDAFAMAICAAGEAPTYPGWPGHEPDVEKARHAVAAVTTAMGELRKLVTRPASYVWETDYFEANWQDSFWGDNYPRLKRVKQRYDPDGLFFLHHGVSSEDWSADGFTRVAVR
jgi:FAD/FMN-containing dehydrogenase